MSTPWDAFLAKFPEAQRKIAMTSVARFNSMLAFADLPLTLRLYALAVVFEACRLTVKRVGIPEEQVNEALRAASMFVDDWEQKVQEASRPGV